MENYYNLVSLFNVCEKIGGQKRLHETVHIIQSLGFPFKEHFDFLNSGPYSWELRSEVEELIDSKYIQRDSSERMVAYEPTFRSRDLHNNRTEPAWVGVAKFLNEKPDEDLEAISTFLYLKAVVCSSRDSDTWKKFRELRPNMRNKRASVRKALHEFSELAGG